MGKKISKLDLVATLISVILVSLAIFYLAFTLLKPGVPSGHDTVTHLINSRLFSEALIQGQFPVRWTEWVWPGTSLPLFNFYQVGFYYLVAIFHLVISSISESIKLTILLFWWIGAFFMFLYARRFGSLSGVYAALIYAFTPYLISDIFVRAAYGEFVAITFFICLLWAFDRLVTSGKSRYGLPLSLFLSGLVVSHLPTLVIITPVLIGYYLLLRGNNEVRLKDPKPLLVSLVLGLGLAAFYILPAIAELSLIKTTNLTLGYYDYQLHFVYPQQLFFHFWGYGLSVPGPNDGMSFQFGVIQWVIMAVSLGLILFRPSARFLKPHLIFWILATAYAVFFMQKISLSFWQAFKFMTMIQYPWRFLLVSSVSGAILGGVLLSLIGKAWQKTIIVIISIIAIFVFYGPYLAPEEFFPENFFNINTPAWRESTGITQKAHLEEGYLPKEVGELPAKDIKKWEITKGEGKVEEKIFKNQQMQFLVETKNQMTLRINSHYFPGWKAYIDKNEVTIDHRNKFGFLSVNIPSGTHEVEVNFGNTPVRAMANRLSIISLLLLGIWGLISLI